MVSLGRREPSPETSTLLPAQVPPVGITNLIHSIYREEIKIAVESIDQMNSTHRLQKEVSDEGAYLHQ